MVTNLGGVFFVTIFTNIFWGIMGERIGWIRQVRWFGCLGMALSSLAFYYLPVYAGHNFMVALIPAVMLGIFVAAFVPMTAVFPPWSRIIRARRSRFITCQRG